jgi:predicted dehydrogenase
MIRAALNGLGMWGARLVESVQSKSPLLRFDAAITRDAAKHRELAEKLGLKLFEREEDALASADIDALVLATPHSHHHRQIVAAAKAGKHLFVEKPFALTRRDAEDAVAACAKAGVTLGVGFNRRHAPAMIEMRRRIAAGEIGDVLHIEAQFSGPSGYRLKEGQWRATRAESPGGAMTARGVHALDCMIHFGGLVQSISAVTKRRVLPVDVDDVTTALLAFKSGVTGQLTSLHATGEIWRLHIFGSKGWMESRGDADLVVVGLEGEPKRVELAKADKERAVLEEFAQAALNRKASVIDPAEIVNGVAVLEAIVQSSESGQTVKIAT